MKSTNMMLRAFACNPILLAVILSVFWLVPLTTANAITDDFEGDSISSFWTVTGPGTATFSSFAHSGSQSLQLSASPDYPWWAIVAHDFGSDKPGSVSVWVQGQELCCGTTAALQIEDGSGNWLALLGQGAAQLVNNFVVRVNGNPESIYSFSAAPSNWHLFEIDAGPGGVTFRFDGNTVFTHPSVTSFRSASLQLWGSPWGSAYFDDFTSSAGSEPPTNNPPVAIAGVARTVPPGTPVELDGSTSYDPDGDPLTFSWRLVSKPEGSSANFLADSVKVTFTPDIVGTYVAQLDVSDNRGGSASARITIVAGTNTQPVAIAQVAEELIRRELINVGMLISLDGTQSYDPDGDPLTFEWSIAVKPFGSRALLYNSRTATPYFTPDKAGEYVFVLLISDGRGGRAGYELVVKVSGVNLPPSCQPRPLQSCTCKNCQWGYCYDCGYGAVTQIAGSCNSFVDFRVIGVTAFWGLEETYDGPLAYYSADLRGCVPGISQITQKSYSNNFESRYFEQRPVIDLLSGAACWSFASCTSSGCGTGGVGIYTQCVKPTNYSGLVLAGPQLIAGANLFYHESVLINSVHNGHVVWRHCVGGFSPSCSTHATPLPSCPTP